MLSRRAFGALRCLSGAGLALLLTTQGRLWPWLFTERAVPADSSRAASGFSVDLFRWAQHLLSPARAIAEAAAEPERRTPTDSNTPPLSLHAALPDLSPPRGITATIGAGLVRTGPPWYAGAPDSGDAPDTAARTPGGLDLRIRTALLTPAATPPGAANRANPCIGTAIRRLAPPR